MDVYLKQAHLLRALAHPVRLHILEILARDEACVCHLTAVLKQRQPYVSQHLMLLRELGLVKDRKEGTIVYYHLADPQISQIIDLSREMLRARGMDVSAAAIPLAPVSGCPCPKCEEGGTCR
jgi:DNA-binding transcriptional ArsR family regulator